MSINRDSSDGKGCLLNRTSHWLPEMGLFLAVVLSLWIKQIYFGLVNRPASSQDEAVWGWVLAHFAVLALSLAFLLLAFSPLLLVRRRWRVCILIALNAVLTSLVIADLIHARFFGTATSVLSIQSARMLSTVVPSLMESLRPAYAFLYVDVLLSVVALPRMLRNERVAAATARRRSALSGLAVFVVGLLLALSTRSGVGASGQLGESTTAQAVYSTLGLFPYHIWDAVHNLRADSPQSKLADLERVKKFLSDNDDTSMPELFGVARGRNLILISAESLQTFPIGMEIEGQPVTPRISAFLRECLYFPNFYDQTGSGRTSDGEFMALNSLHPPPAGNVPTQFNANFFKSLPTILTEAGYSTLSACAAPSYVWSMGVMHRRYGFQRSFFEDSFAPAERLNGAWMVDGAFFGQAVSLVAKVNEPFMAFMLSSSSHNPFDMPLQHRELKLGKLEGTLLGQYFHSVRYFDRSFGEFVDGLRRTGLLDRSVIVVYGDHKGVWAKEVPQLNGLLKQPDSEFYRFEIEKRVPFFIRLPGGQGARRSLGVAGHLDIAPTILSLLGIEGQSGLMLGKNLMTGRNHLVAFRDGSFAADGKYYIQRPDPSYPPACYNADTGQSIPCETLQAQYQAGRERLEVSDLILSGDLMSDLQAERTPAEARSRTNALDNPGLERQEGGKPVGWAISGAPSFDGLGLYAASGKFAFRSATVSDVLYQKVQVTSTKTYLFECFARATGPGKQGKVQLNWFDAKNNLLKEHVETINIAERWQRYARLIPIPPSATHAILYISTLDPGMVWFDDLFFGT